MRTQVLVTAGIFVGYWALQMFVPVPGHVPGQFKEGALLSDWIYWHTIGLLPKPWASPWHGGDVITLTTHGATAMLGVCRTAAFIAAKAPWVAVVFPDNNLAQHREVTAKIYQP